MLYIVLGNAIVMIMSMINGGGILYEYLCFDKTAILQGQVWRLITCVFTQRSGGVLQILLLYFFYMLGRRVEDMMGTLKFNLYYFTGVIFMDIFAMIFCPMVTDQLSYAISTYYSAQIAYYLHLSLILTFATTHPDTHFLLFFIIPIKAWFIALVYLLMTAVEVFNLSYPVMLFPHNLFPMVALGNYFIFMGNDISKLIPRRMPPKSKKKQEPRVIPFHDRAPEKPEYSHRCTVCGRTDVTNPELEFRYCSRCNGYHCYCEDHISNHTHIE